MTTEQKTSETQLAEDIRLRLVEVGATTSQDFGLGRIFGQVLVYLYMSEGARSLDEIEDALGLSKASVSITARQMESLGLLRRVWKKGDRKSYYCTAENIGTALHHGLLAMVTRKVELVLAEIDNAESMLREQGNARKQHSELAFLDSRLRRARSLGKKVLKVVASPILRFFT